MFGWKEQEPEQEQEQDPDAETWKEYKMGRNLVKFEK